VSGAEPRRDTKWWGWGDPETTASLPAAALEHLDGRIGLGAGPISALSDVQLPDPLPLPDRLLAACGSDAVTVGREDRIRHATGQSYPDLVRLRGGVLDEAPDAILVPPDGPAVVRILEACSDAAVAVVPYGGGTSVVGGVAPLRGAHERVVALDLCRLRRSSVDRRSLIASLGPGLRGPEAEALLRREGLTLGHFPQSFGFGTIGGFAATRSAGQASSGYGRFDELVSSVAMATPIGELRTLETPHSAAGPSLRELALGSEGTLGVLTELSVRVREAPEARRYEGWILPGFEEGADAVRNLAQSDLLPDVVRLSDASESEISRLLSGARGPRKLGADLYLRVRGRREGCVLIVGWEGERDAVARRRALGAAALRRAGGVSLGRAPGRAWERGRYVGPYIRDALLDVGVMAETLETSHTWARLMSLYTAVGSAIEASLAKQGTPPIVMCHLSHAYRDGASLYFTFIARQREGSELGQWRAVKVAASEAIVAAGGTITHHHAVGRDHAPYMRAELGDVGLEALRAVKEGLDPSGIMNPGKLLPTNG